MGWMNDLKKVLGIPHKPYTDGMVSVVVSEAALKKYDMSFEEYCEYLSMTGIDIYADSKMYKKVKKEFDKK